MTIRVLALSALFAVLLRSFAEPAAIAADEPQLRILRPGPDDIPLGDTSVQVEVAGNQPGDTVDVFADGRRIGTVLVAPWTVSWRAGEAPRSHSVTAVLVRAGREVAMARVRTRSIGFTASASTQVVTLTPIVTDGRRRYVPGLAKEDFSLLVDGRPQGIETFDAIDSKLSVVLVLDTSASMASKLGEMREAALALISSLKPADEVSLLTFSSNVVGLTPFTADKKAARVAIEDARVEGETALYDATAAALKKVRETKGRRAVIIFTDGEDNRSRISVEQVVEMARASEVTIFSVGQGVTDAGDLRRYLEQMTEETGGRAFFISTVKKLSEAFREVVAELQSQYLLTFTPADQAPRTWHKVELRLGRPDLTARVRRTYFLE